ncbi:MAG: hypothetical protein COU08_04210 [Candidatus Harrisonbacteria bacterium CG10_big_fil_rev_8_21_14_0_10_42_17]|uniref:RecF/RecN/SMC N-terminal domain-containing protein n=1 Tax=Candidatus Harrisonbacteria bacterium CG10_big_fil_rev_8_21_14_0_10_42_17 TaxID=1974584 RepID=A0A2M6WGW0_9BACT|nr:MAG: hypothetical protein COU08_04210 [Candidatus Harrisonbacteria bacterium CG10_big_fil_rev_8_21_14_0_10_42_17]
MHLKRLELVGFKSFAEKTILEFPAGVTAIVGPNGSGKSNIIDSIRWLLGEREAKNVRGLKAEDLIFAGTNSRPRLSLGQVTLVFNNANQFFPVDYNEVAVRRRVSRDGTSDYFLNEAQVRLKDIIDFFAKARLGTKGFSIINQGDSDVFVRSTPQERRVMLEEMLGLRQYQLKKHDAMNKLKSTRINLDKALALLEEMMPHLRMLRRQTSRWEKQESLEKELRELEDKYFIHKYQAIISEGKDVKPELESINNAISQKTKELKELQERVRGVEKETPAESENFEKAREQRRELDESKSKLQKEFGRLEAQLEFYSEKNESMIDPEKMIDFLDSSRSSIEQLLDEEDMYEIKSFLTEYVQEIDALMNSKGSLEDDEKIEVIEKAKKRIDNEIEALDEKIKQLSESEHKQASHYQSFNKTLRAAFEEFEAKKDEISRLEGQKNKITIEQERMIMHREELEKELRQAGRTLEEFKEKQLSEQTDISSTERVIYKLRSELASIGEVDQAVVQEATETEERFTFMKGQSEDLEKALHDLEELINELDYKIHSEFQRAMKKINDEFESHFKMMFGGGTAKMTVQKSSTKVNVTEDGEIITQSEEGDQKHAYDHGGIEIDIAIPQKRVKGLDMLSGGEKSLVSIAALFALISVSPPPFLVLDEVDAALDEQNTRRFASLVKDYGKKTQFVIVTHNRATMEAAEILYGVTMEEDGVSKVLSMKLDG